MIRKLLRGKRFLKYAVVGGTGVIVNEGLLYFFTDFIGLFYLISSIIAIEVAILSNFTWNELWTFKDLSHKHKGAAKRLGKFNAVSIVGILINVVVLFLITNLGIYYLTSNLFGIAAATLWNYFANLKWTWGKN
ncbi:MAG: GtrA family protein [Candidatus Aenigmatarchaeota archaeon]